MPEPGEQGMTLFPAPGISMECVKSYENLRPAYSYLCYNHIDYC